MSSVVHLEFEGPVAVVRMADTGRRNTFSADLAAGLVSRFDQAVAREDTRVVLVEGLPELFCAGGSQTELLNFAEGNGTFDTDDFFRVFAHCPLPVVAAVQGHAIGGGLVLALYADMLVLSERSVYAANFMRYGFTPGMGATHLLPTRFGQVLGQEMLYSAKNYRGAELAARGVSVPVVPHTEVPSVARELAASVARAPRVSLELLKRELSRPLLVASERAIAREVDMHGVSFHLPEVRDRITAAYAKGGAAR